MSSKHHAAQSPRVSPGTVEIGENTQIMRESTYHKGICDYVCMYVCI